MLSNTLQSTREYRADNRGTHDKTLVIEHPFRPGSRLVDTPAPFETTPAVYRFRAVAPAGKVSTFTVREELVVGSSLAILSSDLPALLQYSRTSEIPKNVRDALAKAIELRQSVADVEREIDARTQRIAGITAEQTRIRENMKTVSQNTEYYQRLLGKLNEQESSIEGLQKERDDLTAKRDGLRKQLEDYVNGLTLG